MVEPIVVVDRPGRKLEIKLALDEVVMTETCHDAGERGPDLHVHRHHVDCFYVLDGALEISRADGDHVFGAGTFVLVPPNVAHAFRNHGPGQVRFLNFHAPALGFDRYLLGTPEAHAALATDFDQYPAPDDGGADPALTIVRTAETDAVEVGGVRIGFLADAEETVGAIGLIEYSAPPGFAGPPVHLHEHTWDAYYLLAGRLTIRSGDELLELAPGDVAAVAPGTPHGFATPPDSPARFLDIHAPGGFEQYFREVAAAIATGGRNEVTLAEIASRYDIRVA